MRQARHPFGYTLIEVLVVVGVVSLLATITAVQFFGTNESLKLRNAKKVVEADVRSAVTWAQSGRVEPTTSTVPYGYGVVFTPSSTSYQLYAEFTNNQQFDPSSADVVVETIDLQTDALIDGVQISTCSPLAGVCDLFVEVPNGTLLTNGTAVSDLVVYLTHVASGDTLTMEVNISSGQIQ